MRICKALNTAYLEIIIFAFSVASLLPVTVFAQSASLGEERPNIVILLADDLGWADVGYRGSDIKTPNIDRLAEEGVRLERFYAMPICTPTRAALMTGRDPMKLGSAYAGFQPWETGGVAPEERFMPETFKAAGYETAIVGKWHLGRSIEQLTPNARGFDHFVGHLNTQIDYFDYTVAGGYDLQENGTSVRREGQYATDVHADEAVRFLTEIRDREKPFFLYVPFLAPHSPMQAPPELQKKYPFRLNAPFPKKTYAAMVDGLDGAIGRILDTLDQQGIAENTIVLFFSDNGGISAFGADNSPLRGGKLTSFEGGVRVNAVLRWPNVLPANELYTDIISVMDVYPTLAAASRLQPDAEKELDGQNRLPALTGDSEQPRQGPLYFGSNSPIYNRFHVGVIDGDWKLVQIIDHGNRETTVETFLFNLISDPNEKTNLANDNPKIVDRLSDAINDWRAQHPINGVLVGLVPHPGWRAPLDYAADVTPAEDVLDSGYDGYVSGLRLRILQQRHGEKGRIKYD
ncbi:MAG: arylsulfatase [Pseudomonadota bacterium]